KVSIIYPRFPVNQYSTINAGTMANWVEAPSSTVTEFNDKPQRISGSTPYFSSKIVDEILEEIFAERRGQLADTDSSCDLQHLELQAQPEPHVDKRLKYWREMLQQRRQLQQRVQLVTGKLSEEVLFNRPATLDNRNKQTMVRLLDYAERLQPDKLHKRELGQLRDLVDPCSCEWAQEVYETLPQAERKGRKAVEIIGLPKVTQHELLGSEAAEQPPPEHIWLNSQQLDKHIEKHFYEIHNVLEFMPDLDALQVTGINVERLKRKPHAQLIGEEELKSISTSSYSPCSEECLEDGELEGTEANKEQQPLPELAIRINGKDYNCSESPIGDCQELYIEFNCAPFERRAKRILQLTNIGKQTLSLSWQQGIYYYNRPTLLLAQDSEFLFDTDSFRLAYGESYSLTVLFQPRKVSMAVELWLLQVDPKIFCGNQESLMLRFHGRCTPPKEYMTRLRELHCVLICKSNTLVMQELTSHLGDLSPLVEPPPTCCAYERTLDERELFNSLNPGYHCERFDDLEVLKGMHKLVKKPREPQWDLNLQTLKQYILRIEKVAEREKLFNNYLELLGPLMGRALDLDVVTEQHMEQQRTRFIYVRGVICNAVEEWEDIVFTVEESFFKPELQRFYLHLYEEAAEEEDSLKPVVNAEKDEAELEKYATAAVLRKVRHSKFCRDALYIQTYTHLCNIAEHIVSVIESTEIVAN
ncbi:CG33140, partial [Drosophila busckii]